MKLSNLYALSEGATGFNGGSYVDEMPHLTLTEAVGAMNEAILNDQLELHECTMRTNDALVEAAVNALSTGTQADFDSIVEMSFADIKTRVVKFFEKILKFPKSIVAKITLQIDKIKMTGHQLYEKYKNSPMLKNKKFSDMTVSGYKFSKNDKLFPAAAGFEADVEKLIISVGGGKIVAPAEFKASLKAEISEKSSDEKKAQKAIDGLKDISRATRVLNMAKALTGSTKLTEGNWQSDLKTELYGEKVELKYGTDFTLDSVAELLKEPANLNYIKDEYIKLDQAVTKYKAELTKQVDEMEREAQKEDNSAAKNNGLSLCTAYFNAYISIISDAYGTINTVKNIKYGFERAKLDQAKMLFGKMLSYKAAKSDNNDAEDAEDVDDFVVEL